MDIGSYIPFSLETLLDSSTNFSTIITGETIVEQFPEKGVYVPFIVIHTNNLVIEVSSRAFKIRRDAKDFILIHHLHHLKVLFALLDKTSYLLWVITAIIGRRRNGLLPR